MVPAVLSPGQIEAAFRELGIDAEQVFELTGCRGDRLEQSADTRHKRTTDYVDAEYHEYGEYQDDEKFDQRSRALKKGF